MSTSGSYNFSMARDDIVKAAYQYIGAVGEGETPSTSQTTEAALWLNMIVKLREADGMPLWALKRGTILPVTGVSSVATDSHIVTTYRYTTTSAASASAASTITLTSVTGVSNGDVIGVEISGGMQWTTVNGAPSGSVVTLTAALTAAVASGADVYVYTASTDRVQKPLRIIEANILHSTDNTSHSITVEDRSDYYGLGNRTATGVPTVIYYDLRPTSDTSLETNGQVFIYPRFVNGDDVIEFTYHRPFQDFDSSTDEPDFPQAFYLPLTLELASLLGPKNGVSAEERAALKQEAKDYRDQALMTQEPEGSVSFGKDNSRSST